MDTNQLKVKMEKILEVLRTDLSTVRTGRAAPSLVENISVMVYGGTTRMKIMEVATITTSDTHTIIITPFDNSIIGEIQKGIEVANVGLQPVIDGQIIRISIPQLSEERREQLIHLMKQKLENGRIMVRQVRQGGMQDVKKPFGSALGKQVLSEDEIMRLEKEIQKETDSMMSQIDDLGAKKEAELMQI